MDPPDHASLPKNSVSKPRITMELLPDELWLHVASNFDGKPPSKANFFEEPSLNLTGSECCDLKSLSRACRRWRRIVLPLLFRHTRVPLFSSSCVWTEERQLLDYPRFSAQSCLFLRFLEDNDLVRHVKSIVVYTQWYSDIGAYGSEHEPLYLEAASFWENMFNIINPLSIVIVAPPVTLALLLGVEFPVLRDKWAFDMPYHIFEFRQDPQSAIPDADAINTWPLRLMDVRNWTHMGYNEGSYLSVYSTYEYYAKVPPSLLRYMIWMFREKTFRKTSSLQSLTYVAIFPTGDYVLGLSQVMTNISGLRHLNLQLAPEPNSAIMDDPDRMKRAQPGDLWLELNRSYTALNNLRWTEKASVSSRDYRWPALVDVLDDDHHLGRLREGGWTKVGEATWSRDEAIQGTTSE